MVKPQLMISLAFLLLVNLVQAEQSASEPTFQLVESHSLEFPVTQKEFSNWFSYGSAIIMKNRVVIAPEVQDKKGALQATALAPEAS